MQYNKVGNLGVHNLIPSIDYLDMYTQIIYMYPTKRYRWIDCIKRQHIQLSQKRAPEKCTLENGERQRRNRGGSMRWGRKEWRSLNTPWSAEYKCTTNYTKILFHAIYKLVVDIYLSHINLHKYNPSPLGTARNMSQHARQSMVERGKNNNKITSSGNTLLLVIE